MPRKRRYKFNFTWLFSNLRKSKLRAREEVGKMEEKTTEQEEKLLKLLKDEKVTDVLLRLINLRHKIRWLQIQAQDLGIMESELDNKLCAEYQLSFPEFVALISVFENNLLEKGEKQW